jgi:ABC-type multidrug transport system permease subunit
MSLVALDSMRRVLLVLRKDLRVLRRTPLLLGVLIAYPLLIAALVGLVAGYANAKPRVALVDLDDLPETVAIGGRRFHVDRTIDRVSSEVQLVRLSSGEAERQLETGEVVATLTVPDGFIADLRAMVRSPRLILETTRGGLAPRVTQQVQALVYSLNRELQEAYIETNLEYTKVILEGGKGQFLGRTFSVLGLEGAERLLNELPSGPRLDKIREFVRTAKLALAETDDALRSTANPIELEQAPDRGRTWVLSAQVQAYALALTLTFLTLLLAAGALAAERDENVIGRLARGLVGLGELVWAKVVLAATIALALGLAIAVAFGIAIEIGDVTGGEPWSRLPLLAAGLALTGASLGALGALLGALAREARTASLVALLVVLPIVFLGLVPREVVPVAGLVSDGLPFAHAVRFFAAALYDASPWERVGIETAWLAGLGLVFGALARLEMRRLLA